MRLDLSLEQKEARQRFRAFVREHIAPYAGQWDRDHRVPVEAIERVRACGYLAAPHPQRQGGPLDQITYGLLTEEIGRGCSSVRSLLTVHDMVSLAIWRWGNAEVKAEFGAGTAAGAILCALALSEPQAGSDASAVAVEAVADGEGYRLTGRKKWVTFGQIADLFLVLAKCEQQPTAFLVPADAAGLTRIAMKSVVGTRASLLAELVLEGCRVPKHHLIGRIGFGLSHVIGTALDHGRYSVAWGSVGIAQACLEASVEYAEERRQFGRPIAEHQLVQRKLTEMIASTRAARLLCYHAGYLREVQDPGAAAETSLAKYFASRAAVRAANDAVQIHGANGLTEEYNVERYLRDAKVTEIIEGSTEIQQTTIPRLRFAEL
ncbi:MAG TPA: acyl-CoA dehydrogenase family protein [Vicinamibacterales bacterium]|nr:acyl-CoA dehydrogenase family protein [Vicinamibacterales bacterium]